MTTQPEGAHGTSMNIARRAALAARIFDIVAWLVLAVGAIGAVIIFFTAFSASDNVGIGLLTGLLGAVAVLIYTAITWASITLATAIAGYVANRSEGA